ncbi:hypothetical protein [Parvicella tangerina]|uniref:Uncharacterized protein n=1 Tax=Parvicella tangerina TaxID=2829795 RepID=A0A916JNV3_9FLAO|nr:hypothetical protein [Parvicella tangerina]CAG5084661.1 hypothetical protein CRYO30217_02533 [Parvicella tangerina]
MLNLKETYRNSRNKEYIILTAILILTVAIAIIFYFGEVSRNNTEIEELKQIPLSHIHDNINGAKYVKSKKIVELLEENKRTSLWYMSFFKIVAYVNFGAFLIVLLYKWKN